ncbi:MAG: tRNA uridine-5-carboxymethylaminomethyl(34) synthesis GTPase MnmE [Chitinophagales bacterium]|nr:tRNA uridine-5-carboxymethylaminomethyl(34) synthesis GTPase MnmE [Chitinophagales bacterium]MDW8418511.1 tRNA uridine-5-carboxymethylaminomethyl(34) synthesis GTPase MnmE [Chitinophagales bacterium]
MLLDDTIAAPATPPGRGAISVIRLSGKDAIAICSRIFRGKDLSRQASHTVHYGYIIEPAGNKDVVHNHVGAKEEEENVVDEVMVTIFRAPRSFTAEDVVEISCHGSPYIVDKIMQLLVNEGARTAGPGEFTMRAFLNGRIRLTQAEAVADIIASESAVSHKAALRQLRGGFAGKLETMREQLVRFAADLELELDFSQEDVEFVKREEMISFLDQLIAYNDALIESFGLGNAIKKGVSTVIAGRPNAGKSTLLNQLLNEERAIVSDIPGTTRDTVEEVINIRGIMFRLIDTAGIRQTDDAIEKIGVEKTLEKLQASTLFIYLFDVNTLQPDELLHDIRELNLLNHRGLLLANKIDKARWWHTARYYYTYRQAIATQAAHLSLLFISAQTGYNLDLLRQKLYAMVAGDTNLTVPDTLITNIRHYEALSKANEALHRVKRDLINKVSGELVASSLRDALYHMGEITGRVYNDEILGSIFSRFCIGK